MGLLERIQQYVLTNTSNKKYTFVFAPKYIHNTFFTEDKQLKHYDL